LNHPGQLSIFLDSPEAAFAPANLNPTASFKLSILNQKKPGEGDFFKGAARACSSCSSSSTTAAAVLQQHWRSWQGREQQEQEFNSGMLWIHQQRGSCWWLCGVCCDAVWKQLTSSSITGLAAVAPQQYSLIC
jgi:hypothetical protein